MLTLHGLARGLDGAMRKTRLRGYDMCESVKVKGWEGSMGLQRLCVIDLGQLGVRFEM